MTLPFSVGSFEWGLFLSRGYCCWALQRRSPFWLEPVGSPSDFGCGSWGPSRCWPALNSRAPRSRASALSVASGALDPKTSFSSYISTSNNIIKTKQLHFNFAVSLQCEWIILIINFQHSLLYYVISIQCLSSIQLVAINIDFISRAVCKQIPPASFD